MTRHQSAIAHLNGYKLNDVRVFDGTSQDLAATSARQAHAVLIILSAAIEACADPQTDESAIRSVHVSGCVDAVATLLAMSVYAVEGQQS